MASSKSQSGFTLIELAVTLALMSMIAAATVPNMMEDINDNRAIVAIQETQTILDAARAYREQNGTWPDTGVCANAMTVMKGTSPPFLAGVGTTNKYNSPITTSCTATTFSVDQNSIKDWDTVMANGLPATQVVDPVAHLVRTTIGIPGTEPGLDEKLSRTANGNAELNRMRTKLLLGNNDINEVNNISAVSMTTTGKITAALQDVVGRLGLSEYLQFYNFATESNACATTGLVSRTSGGQPLYCQGGTWVKPISWNTTTVNTGGGCGNYPKGSMGFDASGKLYVCK